MRLALSCALLASALLGMSACNKAESPENVQADIAKAKSDAVEANAKADEKVRQVEADAAKDRADALAKVADKSVGAVVDSAVTQAEGETKSRSGAVRGAGCRCSKSVQRQGKCPLGCSKSQSESCQVRLSGIRRRISNWALAKNADCGRELSISAQIHCIVRLTTVAAGRPIQSPREQCP